MIFNVLRQEYYILVFFWIRRVQVRNQTVQPDYLPLTIFFVSGFFILARFWGIIDDLFKNKQRSVAVYTTPLLFHSKIEITGLKPTNLITANSLLTGLFGHFMWIWARNISWDDPLFVAYLTITVCKHIANSLHL